MKIKKVIPVLILAVCAKSFAGVSDIDLKLQEFIPHLTAIDTNVIKTAVSVGEGIECDFNTIQKAIDFGADLIRISAKENPYLENLHIINNSVSLQGNFASCQDANNNVVSDVKAVIDGDQFNTVITFSKSEGEIQRNKLSHLQLINGRGTPVGGGISALNIDMLYLSDVVIKNNGAFVSGAGIYANSTNLYIKDSLIDQNGSFEGNGGGIYTDFTAILDGQTKITNNLAQNGAGLYGRAIVFSPVEVSGNLADSNGGGMAFTYGQNDIYGKQICQNSYCFGVNNQPVTINNNKADSQNSGFGGGLFVSNGDVYLDVFNTDLSQNSAFAGGAIYTESSTGKVLIDSSDINSNRADLATVAFVMGSGLVNPEALTIQNSLIVNNGEEGLVDFTDRHLFVAANDGTLLLYFNTITNNNIVNELIFNEDLQTKTEVISNIFTDDNQLYDGNNESTLILGCTLIKNSSGLAVQPQLVIGDPAFVDANNGDYKLNANSPAIDFCDNPTLVLKDKNGDDRGYDYIPVINRFGPYDLGAFEFNSNECSNNNPDADVIFKDGFDCPLP